MDLLVLIDLLVLMDLLELMDLLVLMPAAAAGVAPGGGEGGGQLPLPPHPLLARRHPGLLAGPWQRGRVPP